MTDVDLEKKHLYGFLDHVALLNWCSLMSHRVAINKENVNFDGREFIKLPSGQKVKITIKVEPV